MDNKSNPLGGHNPHPGGQLGTQVQIPITRISWRNTFAPSPIAEKALIEQIGRENPENDAALAYRICVNEDATTYGYPWFLVQGKVYGTENVTGDMGKPIPVGVETEMTLDGKGQDFQAYLLVEGRGRCFRTGNGQPVMFRSLCDDGAIRSRVRL